MILETAAVFAGLSIVMFVAGLALGRQEIALLGAIIMVGVGATGVAQGYQVETGQNVTIETTQETVALDDIGRSSLVFTLDISANDSSPTGMDFDEDGEVMFIAGDETDAIYEYATGDHSLSIATLRANFSVANETTTPTGVETSFDGGWMYVTGDDDDSLHMYNLSDPFNVSTASYTDSYDLGAETTTPRAIDFNEDGTSMFVVSSGDGRIYEYELSDPWDVTTASFLRRYDVSAQAPSPTGIDFTDNGRKMVVVGEGEDVVFQYRLDTGYDIGSTSYTGNSLDVGADGASRPSSVAYEHGGTELFTADRFDGELLEYDSSTQRNVTVERTEATYKDVEAVSGFPLEIVVLLLGAIMLISGAGEASEAGRGEPPWRRRGGD